MLSITKRKISFAVGAVLFTTIFCVVFFRRNSPVLTYHDLYYNGTHTPIVFLLPHQDDEMFMAGALRAAQDSGRPVFAIMITDGGASTVRTLLNGQDDTGHPVYSPLDRRYLNPKHEGYHTLDRQMFVTARNREFYNSMVRLGIPQDHIFFANPGGIDGSETPRYPDGQLTKKLAAEAIAYYFKLLGDGTYNTVASRLSASLAAQHGDHAALRDALAEFPLIHEKYFFSEKIGAGTKVSLSVEERLIKYWALSSYYTWKPSQGKFAIAYHSVPKLLSTWRTSKAEYIVKK